MQIAMRCVALAAMAAMTCSGAWAANKADKKVPAVAAKAPPAAAATQETPTNCAAPFKPLPRAGIEAAPATPVEPPHPPMEAMELAVKDLMITFGSQYPRGQEYLDRLAELKKAGKSAGDEAFVKLQREALLANPLLNFDRLLVVKRSPKNMGMPANWQGNCSLSKNAYDNEIAILSPISPQGKLATLYRPGGNEFVGDLALHFDAQRLMFSMPVPAGKSASEPADKAAPKAKTKGGPGTWQVFEIGTDGKGLRQVTQGPPDVDNYTACYLPNGKIIYSSVACFQGVPCVRGSDHVANLHLCDANGEGVRRLTFDQDHDWYPVMLSNGRVMYTRWEYSDIPHAFSRILFHMNPDGTEQSEYYGSNSYWPNSIFYAKPIPGHPTRVVGVVTGHHDSPRAGELILFDPGASKYEGDGVVQRICGTDRKVTAIIRDALVNPSWPKYLHPWPLGENSSDSSAQVPAWAGKYFLVACKPSPSANWGLYLADVFDNLVLIREEPGYALLEPIPLRKTLAPPVIPDKVDPSAKDARVYIVDIYAGDGLKGVPRGTIKKLRLFTYQFAYWGMGGQVDRVGMDGPWDIKKVLGTVPVSEDGSAAFRIPANTPISIQPLDAEGKAVQLMRSWFVGMPGENVSCVGCHERQSSNPANRPAVALTRPLSDITPWYGPVRGFHFDREVQPMLDKYCVGCHDGKTLTGGRSTFDLRQRPLAQLMPNYGNAGGKLPPAYYEIRRFVRAPAMESDLHMLAPYDFHADASPLVQMLRRGHYNVQMDAEAWDRLVTWIDLNTPAYGTWTEICGESRVAHWRDRRAETLKAYAGVDDDSEKIPASQPAPKFIAPPPGPPVDAAVPDCPGWPFDAAEAKKRQLAAARDGRVERSIDLGNGVRLDLVLVPPGEFVMGDANGYPDERPLRRVKFDSAMWVGKMEVTNEQYAMFNPHHDSRIQGGHFLQFSTRERGWPLNLPHQPVVRISMNEAMEFCRWLSTKAGEQVMLPTEAQWEWACRAGTATPLWYGGIDADHGKFANLADASIKPIEKLGWNLPAGAIPPWHPTEGKFDDGARVSADVGSYQPNAWGLHDMAGNVREWTYSPYRPYGYKDDPAAGCPSVERFVVRGGSWNDRAVDARSAVRFAYWPWQGAFDVGFRVIVPAR